ncbi:MAG: hypothetical protein D4R73_07695 [Deltaproteobacteria bacterium]|nr:MAG: hypothetical protein D4R73_07695 [Deltaproteobacteria bacterium]
MSLIRSSSLTWQRGWVGIPSNAVLPVVHDVRPAARRAGSRRGLIRERSFIDPNLECAWVKIYERMAARGALDNLARVLPSRKMSRRKHPGMVEYDM